MDFSNMEVTIDHIADAGNERDISLETSLFYFSAFL